MSHTTESPAETYRAKVLKAMLQRLRREQECKEANACCAKVEQQGRVYRSQLTGRGQRGTGLKYFGH